MSTTVQKIQLFCARFRSWGAVGLAAWVAMILRPVSGRDQTVSKPEGEGRVRSTSQTGRPQGTGVSYRRGADGPVAS